MGVWKADTSPGQTPLLGRHPPIGQTLLLGRHHLAGRHSPGQTPPWADTPWQANTPLGRPLQQTVHILLECILVRSTSKWDLFINFENLSYFLYFYRLQTRFSRAFVCPQGEGLCPWQVSVQGRGSLSRGGRRCLFGEGRFCLGGGSLSGGSLSIGISVRVTPLW